MAALFCTTISLTPGVKDGAALAATQQPPRRPAKSVQPPAPNASPPATSEPQSPPPAQPPQRQPVDIDPDKLQPLNLPPASRQRMRLCGERWRDLKMAGKSAGLTWRSFAEKCLPGQD